jgi:hypothetical protein
LWVILQFDPFPPLLSASAGYDAPAASCINNGLALRFPWFGAPIFCPLTPSMIRTVFLGVPHLSYRPLPLLLRPRDFGRALE